MNFVVYKLHLKTGELASNGLLYFSFIHFLQFVFFFIHLNHWTIIIIISSGSSINSLRWWANAIQIYVYKAYCTNVCTHSHTHTYLFSILCCGHLKKKYVGIEQHIHNKFRINLYVIVIIIIITKTVLLYTTHCHAFVHTHNMIIPYPKEGKK